MTLAELNALDHETAQRAFLQCCGAVRWAQVMAGNRPYPSAEALYQAAKDAFTRLQEADWLQAFAQHPKIGDLDSLREKYSTAARWSESEQAGVESASEAVLQELAAKNQAYLKKFGFIFIVCAAGKSAVEMLGRLDQRLGNDRQTELGIAADEQQKITFIRLEKLLQ